MTFGLFWKETNTNLWENSTKLLMSYQKINQCAERTTTRIEDVLRNFKTSSQPIYFKHFLRTQWYGGFYVNKEFLVGLKWSVKLRKVFPLSRDELFASHFVPESMNPCRLVDSRRHRFLWVTPRRQRSHFIEYQIDRFQFNKLFRVPMSWQQ